MKLRIDFMEKRIIHYGQFRGCTVMFIKLAKCNLVCRNCKGFNSSTTGLKAIMKGIMQSNVNKVVFSGGEPLIQNTIFEVVYELVSKGIDVLIETNGTISLDDTLYKRSFKFRVNLRVPSNGTERRNDLTNLPKLHYGDEVNFNVTDILDYNYAKSIIKSVSTKAEYVITIKESNPIADLVESWIIEDGLVNIRLDYNYEYEKEE